MNTKTLACTFAVVLTAICMVAAAEDKIPHAFAVGTLGTLTLPVDSKWREIPPPPNAPPTIGFESSAPNRFQLLLTPIPVAGGRKQTDADVRALVEKSARDAAPGSVEKNLPLSGVAGAEARGYVFHATDAAPAPGEFRRMYQGAVALGPVLATFTVLYNDGAEDDAKSALSSIQALHFVQAK
jgi:hypothetical protein